MLYILTVPLPVLPNLINTPSAAQAKYAVSIGTRLRPHKDRLELSVTQQDIADMIGLTRETTSIELKKLELKNIISHTRKSYVLFVERLGKYLGNR